MEAGIAISITLMTIALLAIYLVTTLKVPERIGDFVLFRVALYLLPVEIFLGTFVLVTAGAEDKTALVVFTILCQAVLVISLMCFLISILVRPPGQRLRRQKTGQVPIPDLPAGEASPAPASVPPPEDPPADTPAPPEPEAVEDAAPVGPPSTSKPKTKARRVTKIEEEAPADTKKDKKDRKPADKTTKKNKTPAEKKAAGRKKTKA